MRRAGSIVATLLLVAIVCGGAFFAPAWGSKTCDDAIALNTATYVDHTLAAKQRCRLINFQNGNCHPDTTVQREQVTLRSKILTACVSSDLAEFKPGTCGAEADGQVSRMIDCIIKQADLYVDTMAASLGLGSPAPPTPTPRPTPKPTPSPTATPPPCQPALGGPCSRAGFSGCCDRNMACVVSTNRLTICGFKPIMPTPPPTPPPSPRPTPSLTPRPTPSPTPAPFQTPSPHPTPSPTPTKRL
jgi:hypothetical protein